MYIVTDRNREVVVLCNIYVLVTCIGNTLATDAI